MNTAEWAVLIAGLAAIALVNWWFLGPDRTRRK